METLEAMRIFLRVADYCSFTQAAESLSLPKANASLAVSQLEEQLGARLLNRTTRRVSVTPEGTRFYERCRRLVADFDDMETMFQSEGEVRGRLRVDLPLHLSRRIFPRLGQFLRDHPKLELELSTTDRLVDVIAEGFDCVLRVGGDGPGAGLQTLGLGSLPMVNCISPMYADTYGTPKTLEDLSDHRLIHYLTSLGSRSSGFEYWDRRKTHHVEMEGSIAVNNTDAYQAACLAGLGLIQVPLFGVREHLRAGRMATVLDDFVCEPMTVQLLAPKGRHLTRRALVFQDWLAQVLREEATLESI